MHTHGNRSRWLCRVTVVLQDAYGRNDFSKWKFKISFGSEHLSVESLPYRAIGAKRKCFAQTNILM